jgi:hypothetical protein
MPVFSIFSSFSAVWILDPDAQTALGQFRKTPGQMRSRDATSAVTSEQPSWDLCPAEQHFP